MNVILRNPTRRISIDGPISVTKLLRRLDLNRESVLVVRNGTLVPGDAVLGDDETIEIRPVISGGGIDGPRRRPPGDRARRREDDSL